MMQSFTAYESRLLRPLQAVSSGFLFSREGAELAGESSRPREMHIIVSPLLAGKQQCPAGLSCALPKTEKATGPC